jgi:hypothetical protein
MSAALQMRPVAPVVFIGRQDIGDGDSIELFNLTADIDGHPIDSTVSRQTLERAGFFVPSTIGKSPVVPSEVFP